MEQSEVGRPKVDPVYPAARDVDWRDAFPLLMSSSQPTALGSPAHIFDFGKLSRKHRSETHAALMASRPELRHILNTAFVSATWGFSKRRARAAEHCHIVDRLGSPFNLAPDAYVDLVKLPMVGPGYRVTLDQPRWLLRDGLLALSLWEGADRLFSLSFTLGSRAGKLVAYIGGIQGRGGSESLERYRVLTKAACGMRPRDLLIELFRMMCGEIGVGAIHAVSNKSRFQSSFYYRYIKRAAKDQLLDYDAIWSDRGATLRKDRLFDLPATSQMRDLDDVPAKKRAMYRARRALLTEISVAMGTSLGFCDQIEIEHHASAFLA